MSQEQYKIGNILYIIQLNFIIFYSFIIFFYYYPFIIF